MDIRRVRADAYIYYEGLTDDKKRAVEIFFEEMDTDNSADVTIGEFKYFLRRAGFHSEDLTWLFEVLDENDDGALDFQELLTFFYMLGQEEFRELMNAPPITNGSNGRRRPVDQEGCWNWDQLVKLFDVIVNAFHCMLSLAELIVE